MRLITPGTVWRFLLVEVLRLLAMTTAIVVVVIAFAGSIRFFANGTLGVIETIYLAGLLAVPMLQYALPFAGGFGATLAYHRMSQDNELTACYAGGISHRTMLMPAVMVGVLAAAGMFVMADQVMPRFLRRAQEQVSADPTKLLSGRLGGGQSLMLDNPPRLLYADEVGEAPVPAGSKAFKHLVLKGVVALETDKQLNITREMSAPVADVWLYQGEDDGEAGGGGVSRERWGMPRSTVTWVVMELRDPVASKTNQAIGEVEKTQVKYRLPSTFNDNPKFLSWGELERVKDRPEMLNTIDGPRRALAQTLAERLAVDQVRGELAATGITTMIDGAGRAVTLRAGGIDEAPGAEGRGFALRPVGGVVEALVTLPGVGNGGSSVRTHLAARGFLAQPAAGGDGMTTLSLILQDVATTGGSGADGGEAGVLNEVAISGLRVGNDPLPALLNREIPTLEKDAEARLAKHGPDEKLRKDLEFLRFEVADMHREIVSKQQERIGASLACLVMIVLGAVMGMKLGNAAPLVVYLWSFLPSLGTLICISAGQNLLHRQGWPGYLVLYGGIAALGMFTFREYRTVARH